MERLGEKTSFRLMVATTTIMEQKYQRKSTTSEGGGRELYEHIWHAGGLPQAPRFRLERGANPLRGVFETKSGLSSDHKQRETTSCRLQRDSPSDESGA